MNDPKKPTPALVRWIDGLVVGLVKVLIAVARLRARDPRENVANVFRPDPLENVRIRGWQAVLTWPSGKRVGCFVGVLIGITLGGAFLWYHLS